MQNPWLAASRQDAACKTRRALLTAIPVLATSDRKSTRLNSSHSQISYAVFCLKKKNRIPFQYEWAEKLLVSCQPYLCECDAAALRKNRQAKPACVHRIQAVGHPFPMSGAVLSS